MDLVNKVVKSRLLRYFPGKLGRIYMRKYAVRTNGFDEAILSSEGMTCIDLGANVGEFTRRMAMKAKQVIAFEPDPWTYATLEVNVSDLNNVSLVKAAASTRSGVAMLYRHPQFGDDPVQHSEASSIIGTKDDVEEEGSFLVRELDFNRYLEELDEDIGVLKIDIEGAEVELLEALFDRPDILGRINYIFAETHERLIPEHRQRVKELRTVALRLERPYVNLYWR